MLSVRPDFYLCDDGTLDTVIACATCGWEGRFNPEPGDDIEEGEEWDRVGQAYAMAEEDHECDMEDY